MADVAPKVDGGSPRAGQHIAPSLRSVATFLSNLERDGDSLKTIGVYVQVVMQHAAAVDAHNATPVVARPASQPGTAVAVTQSQSGASSLVVVQRPTAVARHAVNIPPLVYSAEHRLDVPQLQSRLMTAVAFHCVRRALSAGAGKNDSLIAALQHVGSALYNNYDDLKVGRLWNVYGTVYHSSVTVAWLVYLCVIVRGCSPIAAVAVW